MTSADQWMKTLRDEKVTAEAKVKIEQVEIQFNNSQKKVNDIMKELKEEREFSCQCAQNCLQKMEVLIEGDQFFSGVKNVPTFKQFT